MTNALVMGFNRQTTHALSELTDVAGTLETVFLDAGNGLGQAVECWHTISETFGALAGQFDRPDMQSCIDDLGAALGVAGELGGGGRSDVQTCLGDLETALAAMRTRLERLNRTIAEVKLVALNAKVEAAHLDEHGTDFTVFTREIDRLAADAAGELAALDSELRGLADQTSEARLAQSGFVERHGGELLPLIRRLDDSLRTLTQQRGQVADAALSIGQRSRLAGDKVGQAVMALQIGDITRQRTEHVADAMAVLVGLCGNPADLTPDDAAQAAALVASLQSRQLEQTAADLREQVRQVTHNLADLAGETEAITTLGHDSFGGGGGSFLAALGHEIGQVERLLADYAAAFDHTGTIMRSVSAAAATMAVHVEAIHSIEADLKIMALNASFKCARLGERGRTLSVVAQSLRQLANRTVEDAGTLMSGLHTAQTRAGTLAEGQRCGDTESIGRAVDRLRAAATLLAAIGAEQAGALGVLETDSRRAQAMLHACCEGIAVSDGFAHRLCQVAQELREIADAAPVAPDRVEDLKVLVLSRLSGNYTMASERTLHELFGIDASQSEAAGDDAMDVDDLLF